MNENSFKILVYFLYYIMNNITLNNSQAYTQRDTLFFAIMTVHQFFVFNIVLLQKRFCYRTLQKIQSDLNHRICHLQRREPRNTVHIQIKMEYQHKFSYSL